MTKKEITALTNLSDALLQAVIKFPPPGFNTAYFVTLFNCGRVEEATTYLNNITKDPAGES